MASEENPKLKGSNIVDCIPQTGECPYGCSECFYNGGRFYRTLEQPLIPDPTEVGSRIVRMNCGNDSNNRRDLVLATASKYTRVFFNTSYLRLDFPGPVVLTVNPQYGKDPVLVDPVPSNLMFVRVRVGLWEDDVVRRVAEHYQPRGVPVVVTFMRYYDREKILPGWQLDYEWRRYLQNDYFLPKTVGFHTGLLSFMEKFKGTGVRMCGRPWSSLCVDCGQCEEFYWAARRRMELAPSVT